MIRNPGKLAFPWLFAVLLATGSPLLALEKVGITSFQFLKVMTDARSTAMGEAYSSVVKSSLAMFWNPAALTRISRFDLAFSHADWFLDARHFSFVAAYSVLGIGTFGFQGLLVDYGEIEETRVDHLGFIGDTYNPGLTGNKLYPGANAFGISFARDLTDKFAFGVTMKYAGEDLVVKSTSSVMFDAGITYRTGYRTLQLAAVVRHFGPEVKYIDESFPLPQTFNLGISGYLVAPQDNFLFSTTHHTLLLAFDMVQPRDYDQQYNIGLEYGLYDLIFLRSGYKINYDAEGLCLGAGLKYGNIRADYSFNDNGRYLGLVHRFTLGVSID
ncbi:MAG: PorV/PorQ family protein [Fidelibacterota bacterium]|nr:MAG: PorV/PorQ family protein [Candidatus Neomarinimicrobiota bacterium]